jgi:hypothetical protein
MSLLIPIFGVIFGTITTYLTKTRLAELEANLKQEMLQRGLSAEEIKMIIEATPRGKWRRCATESKAKQEVS